MDIDTLYPLVTDAIRTAEALEGRNDAAARHAFSEVSRLEEQIARVVPLSDYEGIVARRGAVRAAIKAHQSARALDLITRFEAERDIDPGLAADLRALRAEAINLAMQDQERFAELGVAVSATTGPFSAYSDEPVGNGRLDALAPGAVGRGHQLPAQESSARRRDKLMFRLTYIVLVLVLGLLVAAFVLPIERKGRAFDLILGLVPALIGVYGTIMGFYMGERRAFARNGLSAENDTSSRGGRAEGDQPHQRAFGQG